MDILSTQRLSECHFLCHMFRITVLKQQTFLRKKNNKQDFVLFLNSFSSISALFILFHFQIILKSQKQLTLAPPAHENVFHTHPLATSHAAYMTRFKSSFTESMFRLLIISSSLTAPPELACFSDPRLPLSTDTDCWAGEVL